MTHSKSSVYTKPILHLRPALPVKFVLPIFCLFSFSYLFAQEELPIDESSESRREEMVRFKMKSHRELLDRCLSLGRQEQLGTNYVDGKKLAADVQACLARGG